MSDRKESPNPPITVRLANERALFGNVVLEQRALVLNEELAIPILVRFDDQAPVLSSSIRNGDGIVGFRLVTAKICPRDRIAELSPPLPFETFPVTSGVGI